MTHKDLMPGDKIRLTGWAEHSEPELFAGEGNVFPCEATLYNEGPLLLCLKDWSVRYFTFEFIERFDGSKPMPKSVLDAAPEMLEALEYLFEKMDEADNFCVKDTGDHLYPYSKFKEIDNIIKKAKGEK